MFATGNYKAYLKQSLSLIIPAMLGGIFCAHAAIAQPALKDEAPPANNTYVPSRPSKPTSPALIKTWFQSYDAIRRQAQMNPSEKQKADAMMAQGLAVVIPGAQKAESQQLLVSLVKRYQAACAKLKMLPLYPETAALHKSYYQYFAQAGQLFSDYLRVQDNLFATDEQTGKPLASQLMNRKEALESVEQRAKYIDSQVRTQFDIAPYQY